MVPVVKNADDLSIVGLSNQLKEVANACKAGSVNPDILSAEAGSVHRVQPGELRSGDLHSRY